jgi:hypothetical protein
VSNVKRAKKGDRPKPSGTGLGRGKVDVPKLESLILRRRIEVVEQVLSVLHAVEPVRYVDLEAEIKHVAELEKRGAAQSELNRKLEERREVAGRVREVIEVNRHVLDAIEDRFLPDHGVVGEGCDLMGHPVFASPLSSLQLHVAPSPRNFGWRSTVFRCAAACEFAGSECVEPAVLGCVLILRALRDLVGGSVGQSDNEEAVFDQRGHLRLTARAFLEALDQPRDSLDAIASAMKKPRDGAHVRRFSPALQALGFVRQRSDKTWERTAEGTLLLEKK